jgi:hypothetical protein
MHEPAGKQGPTREPVEDLVREFLAKTFTNLGKKQSQSCSPKKFGFRVWTSVRFVNMLGGKDDPVCVHTGNILRGWGCYRHVKVPSSPYKRGREGTCKWIQTFWNLCYLQRESQSICVLTLYLNVLRTLTCVWVVIRIFRVTPQQLLTWLIFHLQPELKLGLLVVFYSHKPIIYIPHVIFTLPWHEKNNCQMIHQISANITLHNGIEKGGKLLRQGVVTTITHLLVTSCTKVRTPLGILLSQTYHLLTTCHSFLHVNEDGSTM